MTMRQERSTVTDASVIMPLRHIPRNACPKKYETLYLRIEHTSHPVADNNTVVDGHDSLLEIVNKLFFVRYDDNRLVALMYLDKQVHDLKAELAELSKKIVAGEIEVETALG